MGSREEGEKNRRIEVVAAPHRFCPSILLPSTLLPSEREL
jgi:hypothetical protein